MGPTLLTQHAMKRMQQRGVAPRMLKALHTMPIPE
jgi:hypothetical protein